MNDETRQHRINFPNEWNGLLEMCLDLHMSTTGSQDRMSHEMESLCVAYLKERLRLWEPSARVWARFDAAVKELIEAAIAEFESPMNTDN